MQKKKVKKSGKRSRQGGDPVKDFWNTLESGKWLPCWLHKDQPKCQKEVFSEPVQEDDSLGELGSEAVAEPIAQPIEEVAAAIGGRKKRTKKHMKKHMKKLTKKHTKKHTKKYRKKHTKKHMKKHMKK